MHTQLLKSKTGITKIIFFYRCVRVYDKETVDRNLGPMIYSCGTPVEFNLQWQKNLRKWAQIIYRRVATMSLKISDTN